MKILPYNRVVKDLNGIGQSRVFLKISPSGSPAGKQKTKFRTSLRSSACTSGANGTCWRPKPGSFPADPIESLDVSILQKNLLEPILGIRDPRTDKRIDFVGGIRGTAELEKMVDSGKFAVAFSLRATTIEQLFAVADAGKIMPPKSTWFEPKLKDGLVSHLLD